MISVILIDDEPLILKILQTQINWSKYNMNIVNCYTDAQKALKSLEDSDIDVVFTDIQMPHLGGSELIEKGSHISPNTRFVALSSYSDFPLVKRAFKAGAVDYILKVDIDSDSMDSLLQKLMQQILESKSNSTKLSISDYVEYFSFDNDEEIIVGVINNVNDNKKNITEKMDLLKKLYNYQYVVHTDQILIIIPLYNANIGLIDCYSIINQIKPLLVELRGLIIGLSNSGVINDLEKLYYNACKACGLFFYDNTRQVFIFDDIPMAKVTLTKKKVKHHILNYINNFDFVSLIDILRIYMNSFEKLKCEEDELKNDLIDVYTYLINHLSDINLLPNEMIYNNSLIKNKINSFGSYKDLKDWFEIELNVLLKNYQIEKKDNVVEIIRTYINQNYSQELSLTKISNQFGMNRSYLSRMFASEIGINFNEYVNLIKIEKAKSFLQNTDLTIYEVSQKVGYSSSEHFSRKFKVVVGLSPSSFRKRLLSNKLFS